MRSASLLAGMAMRRFRRAVAVASSPRIRAFPSPLGYLRSYSSVIPCMLRIPSIVSEMCGRNGVAMSAPVGSRHFSFTVSEEDYPELVDEVMEILEESLDDDALPFDDVNFSSGVMSIVTRDHGVWIINKHSASRQIWLSSPKSGPNKFEYSPEQGKWISEREDRTRMHDLLVSEISDILGREFKFTQEF
mmetsp:Transcript_14142/g.23696  ORF Transcript_14142/g.23696 Transcript_14142/m.23696 type:complete len:190 (+) Transcript_14142:3-572(+)